MARTARTWKGARTPSALKRVRQSLRRRAVNRRTRSEAKTLVQQASEIALGRSDGDGPEAVSAAISALDKAAEKARLEKLATRVEAEIANARAKLSNPTFADKAPPAVVEQERKRLVDKEAELAQIRAQIGKLG